MNARQSFVARTASMSQELTMRTFTAPTTLKEQGPISRTMNFRCYFLIPQRYTNKPPMPNLICCSAGIHTAVRFAFQVKYRSHLVLYYHDASVRGRGNTTRCRATRRSAQAVQLFPLGLTASQRSPSIISNKRHSASCEPNYAAGEP